MSEVSGADTGSINPNSAVTSNLTKDGTIEADATGGPLSFDELDEVLSQKKTTKAKPKEAKDEKSQDLTSDTDKGKKAEPKEPKKESKDTKDSKEPETEAKPPRKTVKAKYEANEYDLDEDAVVTVKVNGEDVEVPIKDLTSNYSGKTAWDKKFSELDKTRKQTLAQEAKLKQSSEQIKNIFNEQDPSIKMYKMAQLAGVDPVEFRQKFLDENINLLEKYYGMSEDERRADALAYEAQIQRHRADTLESTYKQEQDYKSLEQKVETLRASHKISEQEFVERHDAILAHLQQEYAKTGQADKSLLSPENIVSSIVANRMYSAAEEKVNSLGLSWNEQTKSQQLVKLIRNAQELGLSTQDMLDTIDDIWGVNKAKKKLDEKKKENQEFLSGKKPAQQVTPKTSDPLFFDEIL